MISSKYHIHHIFQSRIAKFRHKVAEQLIELMDLLRQLSVVESICMESVIWLGYVPTEGTA